MGEKREANITSGTTRKKLSEPFVSREDDEGKTKHNFHSIDLILMEKFLDVVLALMLYLLTPALDDQPTLGLSVGDNETLSISFIDFKT